MLVALEHIQNRGGEKHGPVARLGFGRRHYQFALYPVYLPFYPQRPGAEVQVSQWSARIYPRRGRRPTPAAEGVAAASANQQALDSRSKYPDFSGFCGRGYSCPSAEDSFSSSLVQGPWRGWDAPDDRSDRPCHRARCSSWPFFLRRCRGPE